MSPGKELNENQLYKILNSRSKSLIEKIDRNIKIGFALLTLFIAWTLFDYLYLTPRLLNYFEYVYVPKWLYLLDGLTNALIVVTFIYFAVRYLKTKKYGTGVCNLKENLTKIINILTIYKKLFYLILFIILIETITSIGLGISMGVSMGFERYGLSFSDLGTKALFFMGILCLLTFVVFCLFPFLLFRWGFNKLYGNYIRKLKTTLNELNEATD